MQRSAGRLFGLCIALCAAGLLETSAVEARAEADSDWTKAQTFSGALRYLRVDLGYEVVERDPDAAYLMFRFAPPGRREATANGSIEIVEAKGRVKLYVQLPQLPSYHEVVLRDGLLKKLRQEYGTPAPKKPPAPPKQPPADAGAG